MVETREMKIFNDETSAKILNTMRNTMLSEEIDMRVSGWDILSNVISILLRLFTVLFNANLAYEYYTKGEYFFFKMTLCFILIPAFISVLLSITLHYEDSKKENLRKKGFCHLILFVIIFPYTLRFMQSLIYQVKSLRAEKNKDSERQRHYYKLMVMEESDVALIRIIECFLDACPHKIIHMTAILQSGLQPTVLQSLSLTSAFTGFSWSLAAYSRCNRLAQPDKRPLSLIGMLAQCVWHFCVPLSRVISIVLLASVFPIQIVIAIASHAFFMTLWIFLLDRSPFCSYTIFHSFAFSMIFGAVFIFTYILPRETKKTCSRYTFFYILTGLENFLAVILFILYTEISRNFIILFASIPILSFLIGISAMLVYYKFLHPNILSRRDLTTEL
ncbi:CLUMA_CG016527, isoform A [Clunio marinus]|uniref:XK-related protein n=1 Tax=Clunio marinus TaxID=568069 RepID=A0A1J1IXL8_9DIPT|nr:CLUMA_CG016527, isoform A [Clunio marinus]